MTTRTGSCLCGARRYAIEGDVGGVWICHCSNCRKASGSVGNAILIVPKGRFLRPTYTITRCRTCGTPLPAEEDETHVYITAGTLDDPLGEGVVAHIFCGSRGDWDRDAPDVRYFEERLK